MDYTSILIRQTSILFITIIIGVIARKKKIFGELFLKELGDLLFLVINPLTIFISFCTEYSREKAINLLIAFGFGLLMVSLSIIFAEVTFRGDKYRVERFGTVINNSGFFGIPVVSAVFGIEAVFYLVPYIVINNITQFTYGAYTMSGDKKEMSLKKVMINPNIIASILGVAVYFLRIPVPIVINDTFQTVGSTMGTLCAIIIGGNLAETNLKDLKNDKFTPCVIFYRQILIGICAIIVYKLLNLNEMLGYIQVVIFSTPVAAATAVFSRKYGQDAAKAARLISISSLLAVVTMPLVFSLIQYIF